MPYSVRVSPRAKGELARINKPDAQRIRAKIQWLGENAERLRHEALKGEWAGAFKLRVGNFRVIYRLNHEQRILFVEAIGHRREIYKTI